MKRVYIIITMQCLTILKYVLKGGGAMVVHHVSAKTYLLVMVRLTRFCFRIGHLDVRQVD